MSRAALLDERSQPPLRAVLGRLLSRASHASFAIRRVRIAGLDLSAAELGPLQSCRVLVGRLDAGALFDTPGPGATDALERLLRFARSGRLYVRSAPVSAWSPDFSVLQRIGATDPASATGVCIVGCHYFREPDPPDGPALTTLLTAPSAVRLALRRFEALWALGYDVLPAVEESILRLLDTVGP